MVCVIETLKAGCTNQEVVDDVEASFQEMDEAYEYICIVSNGDSLNREFSKKKNAAPVKQLAMHAHAVTEIGGTEDVKASGVTVAPHN